MAEVSPIRGKRMKEIIDREGITQAQLAEVLGVGEVHLSNVANGKRRLTDKRAEKIIALYPGYRLSWLLGYDDYMTEEDALRTPLKQAVQRDTIWKIAVECTLQNMGYTVQLNGADGLNTADEALENLGDVSYAAVDRNGKVCAECGAETYYALLREIGDFAEFLIERRLHLEGKRG